MEETRVYQARKEFDEVIKPIFKQIKAGRESELFYDVMWKNEGKESKKKLETIINHYPEIASALTAWGEQWL